MSSFPLNLVDETYTTMDSFFGSDHSVVKRPLRPNDPAQSIGIYVIDWTPDTDSFQIGQEEPAIQRYPLRIHNMIKASDEVTGRALFSLDAKMIRAILYRDPDLLVRLRALNETVLGTRESFKRMQVDRQRFVNNEVRGTFMYVASTDFTVETESTKL